MDKANIAPGNAPEAASSPFHGPLAEEALNPNPQNATRPVKKFCTFPIWTTKFIPAMRKLYGDRDLPAMPIEYGWPRLSRRTANEHPRILIYDFYYVLMNELCLGGKRAANAIMHESMRYLHKVLTSRT